MNGIAKWRIFPMSGHSKWSKVKHQKAGTDAVKAAAFTRAARAITVAVQQGGGVSDPNFNFRLRLAMEKARDVNMPKENIQRAIDKAKGSEGQAIIIDTYEGYAPYGVACLIEVATDNRQRAVSFIKQALEHVGGSMASPGAVSYLFTRRGVLTIPKTRSYDDIMSAALDAGAQDVVEQEDLYEVYSDPQQLTAVRTAFESAGITVENAALIMHPSTSVPLDPEKRAKVEELVGRIEELDDVQGVFTNLE